MIESYQEMVDKLPQQFQVAPFYSQMIGDYLCDTVEDLKLLPEDCALGSRARVISPLSLYARQSSGKWILQETAET